MPKSVPISLRISDEDAEFLANLEISGAITISEKLRAIISEQREQREKSGSALHATAVLREHFDGIRKRIEVAERNQNMHSELLRFYFDWQFQAFQEIAEREISENSTSKKLKGLESEVANKIFHMIDYIARLSLTERAPCYDPAIVRKKFSEEADLLELLTAHILKGKK